MAANGARRRTGRSGGGRLTAAGRTASTAVQEAASVLEGELAATLPGVRRLQQRFTEQGKVDPAEFKQVMERVRATSHEFIDLAADRVRDLRSGEVQELSRRLTSDAHDLFDSMINLVALAPDIVNRMAGRAGSALGTDGTRTTARRRGGKRSGQGSRTASRSRRAGKATRS